MISKHQIGLVVLFTGIVFLGMSTLEVRGQDVSQESVQSLVLDIKSGDDEATSKLVLLCKEKGIKILPELRPYLYDKDANIRQYFAIMLGEFKDQEEIIPDLAALLNDKNGNVRREAIQILCLISRKKLLNYQTILLDPLTKSASEWGDSSENAMLLIADLGGSSKMQSLRKVIAEADSIKDDFDTRYYSRTRMKQAAMKALFKLGDKETERQVLKSVRQKKDVKQIVFGIDAIQYAGKSQYAGYLIPLLDDKRDAKNVAPSGYQDYIRVRDVAAEAIVSITGMDESIKPNRKHSDEEINLLKEKYHEQQP